MYDGLTVDVTLSVEQDRGHQGYRLQSRPSGLAWRWKRCLPRFWKRSPWRLIPSAARPVPPRVSSRLLRLLWSRRAPTSKISSKPVEAKEVAAPDYFPTMGSTEIPEQWDESYDVVVVGGGFWRVSRRLTPRRRRAAPSFWLSSSPPPAATAPSTAVSLRLTPPSARLSFRQKLGLEPDTAEKHIEDTIKGGDNMRNPALVREMVQRFSGYFDLLLDNGLEIRETLARPADTMAIVPTSPRIRSVPTSPTCSSRC